MDDITMEIGPMTENDISQVRAIEKLSFTDLWPDDSFEREIQNKKVALYLCARCHDRVMGYAGTWIILDESHITTVAVDPVYRGNKVGQRLVWHLMNESIEKGVKWATLEVNEENVPAIRIYEKFGFSKVGRRKEYYGVHNAIVMWAGSLQKAAYRERMDMLKAEIFNGRRETVL